MPKFKVQINNDKSYTLKDGFILEDVLGETLDSGNLVFVTDDGLEIEAFDDFRIYDDSQTPSIADKYFLADTGYDEIAYFEPTQAKTQVVNMFSRTKWLERFTLPILTITRTEKVISDDVTVLFGSINVSGSINSGEQTVNIPLDPSVDYIRYNSIEIQANLVVDELLNLRTDYYYNTETSNNLPAASSSNIGKSIAVYKAKAPSDVQNNNLFRATNTYKDNKATFNGTTYGWDNLPNFELVGLYDIIAVKIRDYPSGTVNPSYTLYDRNTYNYNSYTEDNDLPSGITNGKAVLCNYLEPVYPYDRLVIYTSNVLNWSDNATWASTYSAVADSQIFIAALDNAGTDYIHESSGSSTPRNLTFSFNVGNNGTFKVLKDNVEIATITSNSQTYTMSGNDMMLHIMTFKYESNGGYAQGTITRQSLTDGEAEYPSASISLTAYSSSSPATLVYESSDWKKLFYPATLLHFLYFYDGTSWVRHTKIENYNGADNNGLYANVLNTKTWKKWSAIHNEWENYTLTYTSTKKIAKYNSGWNNFDADNNWYYYPSNTIERTYSDKYYQVQNGAWVSYMYNYTWKFYRKDASEWFISDTYTNRSYYCRYSSAYFRWNGSDWVDSTEHEWKRYSYLTNAWEDVGTFGSDYYQYNNEYYKWNTDQFEQYTLARILGTTQNGVVTFKIGDPDNHSTVFNGVINYNINAHTLNYGGVSVWTYIKRYCDLFLPKVRYIETIEGVDHARYTPAYNIATRVQEKFASIECPEFQWNEPTLREVLTDLMYTANCIPIINSDNEIDYMDLTEKGNPIDTSKVIKMTSSFSSNDYCSELTITMKNAIGTSKTRITEYTTLRCNEGELTTENAILKTQHPIYDIKKVVMCYSQVVAGSDNYTYRELDITSYVVEKKVWDTFNVTNTFYDADQDRLKANHVYYTRGSNAIEGWGNTYKMIPVYQGVYQTYSQLVWIITTLGNPYDYGVEYLDIRNSFMFKIEYETIAEHKLHIGKYLPTKHLHNRLFDNQSNSYVDVNRQSIYEYAKVNRLSNKIKTISAIYRNESSIPELGDYIMNNGEQLILFNRKRQYFDGQINFEGQLVANYILRDYFTGVQAKKRSWKIVDGKEALSRRDVFKLYLEASFDFDYDSKLSEDTRIFSFSSGGESILYNCLGGHTGGNAVKWVGAILSDSENIDYPTVSGQNAAYCLETSIEICGNSLVASYDFGDNFSIGDYVEIIDSIMYNNNYRYVDENGEFVKMYLGLLSYVDPSDGEFTWAEKDAYATTTETLKEQMKAKGMTKNLINLAASDIQMNCVTEVFKDNREIICGDIQIELCSDTPDIILKPRLFELSSIINNGSFDSSTLKLCWSDRNQYDIYSEVGYGMLFGTGNDITLTGNKVTLTRNPSPSTMVSWGICDADGKLIVGINGNKSEFYLNVLLTRDRDIYNPVTKAKVGSLND